MNTFPPRLVILVVVIGGGFACSPNSARAQETQRQKQEQNGQQNQYRDQGQALQQDQAQHDVQAYRGQVSSKHGNYYLEDARSRTSYLLKDREPKKFVNKKVRVTGWLDADKEILHVISVSTIP